MQFGSISMETKHTCKRSIYGGCLLMSLSVSLGRAVSSTYICTHTSGAYKKRRDKPGMGFEAQFMT